MSLIEMWRLLHRIMCPMTLVTWSLGLLIKRDCLMPQVEWSAMKDEPRRWLPDVLPWVEFHVGLFWCKLVSPRSTTRPILPIRALPRRLSRKQGRCGFLTRHAKQPTRWRISIMNSCRVSSWPTDAASRVECGTCLMRCWSLVPVL